MSMDINGNLPDYSVRKQNYSSVYESTYAAQKQRAAKKEETKESSKVKTKNADKNSNKEYLKGLQKQIPYMKLQIGYGVNIKNDGKADVLDINPKLLEKIMKAYCAKQDADKLSQTGDTSKKLMLMRSSADSLKKSADALNNDALWEKKKIKKKDETTGEETEVEDYDWNAITKTVKSFIDDYNSVVEEAGSSDTKNVLCNAVWMINMTDKSKNLLSQVGITVGKGNKLELDEDALKKSDITTLKSLFTGYGSFGDKISQKAGSISNAAARTKAVDKTYTSSGSYSDTLQAVLQYD